MQKKKLKFIPFILCGILMLDLSVFSGDKTCYDRRCYMYSYSVFCKDGSKETEQVIDTLKKYINELGKKCFKGEDEKYYKEYASVQLKGFINKIKYPEKREILNDYIEFCYNDVTIGFEGNVSKITWRGNKDIIKIDFTGYEANKEAILGFSRKIKENSIAIMGESIETWWWKY